MASGLLACLAYIVFEASLIGIFSSFAQTTFQDQLGLAVPWQVFAFFMLILNAILAYFDINFTAKVLAVLLITEISVLAVMAFAVLFAGGGPDGIPLSPLSPLNAFTGPAAGLGLFFAFWSWVGFESTAMYGEESREPKRIIPRANLITVIGVGVFYVFVSWMAIAGNGLSQSVQRDAFAVFFDPTRQFVGQWAVLVFQWLIITGSFACGMAFHNCAARYLYAIGREGFISRSLGKTHPTYGSPYVASLVQTAIAGTRNNHPEARHWFRTFLAPLLGGIGMATVVVLLLLNSATAAGDASETLLFKLIPWIIIGVFVAGMGLALYLRANSPERYRMIGRIVYEDTTERPDAGHAVGPERT